MRASVLLILVLSIPAHADWRSEDTLIYSRPVDSHTLDPAAASDGESVKVIHNLYETLVRIDEKGKVVPMLASRVDELDGQKPGYMIHIRKGVKFHDGRSLTAAAVVSSLKRLLASKSPYREFYAGITGVALDAGKVRIDLRKPDVTLLVNLALFPASIISPTAVAKHGRSIWKNPVGTGPFKLDKWVHEDRIVLVRNTEYWGKQAGVSKVVFVAAHNRIGPLLEGEVSIIDGLDPAGSERIRKHPGAKLLVRASGREISLCYLAMNTSKAPFDNVTLRQAIAHSIDRKAIAKLYKGFGGPAELPVPPGIIGWTKEVEGQKLDRAKAKKLLAGSGVKERSFTLMIPANPRPYLLDPVDIGTEIQTQLMKVGIKLKVRTQAWKRFLSVVGAGEHQMCLLGWTTDNGDADNFLTTFFHSSNAVVGRALNTSFFHDKRTDELLALQRKASDSDERAGVLKTLYSWLIDKSPMVPLVYARDAIAHHKALRGVELGRLGERRLAGITIKRE